MIEVLKAKPIMTGEKAESYLGELLGDGDYIKLIDYDCDLFCEETGVLLAKFRKNQIPMEMIKRSYSSFSEAATPTSNRGVSAGKMSGNKTRVLRHKKDGTISKTNTAKVVNSGIIGYFDRTMRSPYCRTTAFTGAKIEKWNRCLPIIKRVSGLYQELVPEKWALQKDWIERTSQDFVIKDTVFTTVTVNKNWQTAVHTDKGDLTDGFGNLVVLRRGKYTGGYFVLVKWGVAFNLQNGDVLFTDVHQVHGNTPIKKLTEDAERISLVMYYRENMIVCGSEEEELEAAKGRTSLKGLNTITIGSTGEYPSEESEK
jgi:hypothetical protein